MSKGIAHRYGDDVNTDVIIAGKYTKTLNFQDLVDHCMEDIDPEFRGRVVKGDVVVAGENFGCGSSREQAPIALKHSGISAVIAPSFARIFYRNAINIGLPALVCDTSKIKMGDSISVDMENGIITVNDELKIQCQKFPPIMQQVLSSGGLVSFLQERGDYILK